MSFDSSQLPSFLTTMLCYLSLVLLLATRCQGDDVASVCRETSLHFATKSIGKSEEGDYLFYGVASDVENLRECARICYTGHFCRSALYDQKKKICKLGYSNVHKCASQLSDKQSPSDAQPLLISCIVCKDDLKIARQPLALPVNVGSDRQIADNIVVGASKEGRAETIVMPSNDSTLAHAVEKPTKTVGGSASAEPKTSKNSEEKSCFKRNYKKAYLRSAYGMYRGYSLKDCQCTCAQTWVASEKLCSSIQYYPERQECVLNRYPLEHPTDLAELSHFNTSLYEFTCAENQISRSEFFEYLFKECSYERLPKVGNKYNVDCNDIVVGYAMKGSAGALEHDVSIEACRCLCFSSATNDKYGFVCRSATYYPKERDCVLNLYDRWQRPDLFQEEGVLKTALYLDSTCDEITRQTLVKSCGKKVVQKPTVHRPSFAVLKGTFAIGKSEKEELSIENNAIVFDPAPVEQIGEHTDACFLEVPEHVLGNVLSVIKDNVTVEECKCACVKNENLPCMSISYMHDAKKCWLNKFNRKQQPKSFSKISNSHTASKFVYFDYLCNSKSRKGVNYALKCSDVKEVPFQRTVAPTVRRLDSASENKYAKKIVPKDSDFVNILKKQEMPFVRQASSVSSSHKSTNTVRPAFTTLSPTIGEDNLSTPKFDYSEYAGGSCSYSALYDAEFEGRNLLEKFLVENPLHCFVECVKRHCRSVNLVQYMGKFKHCHLYGDMAVEYPFTNMVKFRKDSVYFDGITCSAKNASKRLNSV